MDRKKQFQSRADIMKTMKFPDNNNNLVIIPSNIKGTGFLRTCYIKEILDGIISEDEFMSVVDAISKIVAKVYTKKRLADAAGIDKRKVMLVTLSMLFATLFLILIYLAIESDNQYLEIAAYCCVCLAFIIILPLSLYECFRKSDDKMMNFN